MKTRFLKRVEDTFIPNSSQDVIYVCPMCGANMVYENNNAESAGYQYWYECTGCHARASDK